jgi:ribonuclease PH
MRPVVIIPHYLVHPEGSALVAFGDIQVICTASVEERLPPWLQGKGRVTAVSVGVLAAGPQLDLDYGMDSSARSSVRPRTKPLLLSTAPS